jgi:hypothetical protein
MTFDAEFLAAIAPALRTIDQAPSTGTDPSGIVTVEVGRGGTFSRVDIRDSWTRLGGADSLVAAVLMANATATATGMGLAVDVDAVRSYRPGSGAEMLRGMIDRARQSEPDPTAASEVLARMMQSQTMPAPLTPSEAEAAFARLDALQGSGTLAGRALREVADPQRYVVISLDSAGCLIDVSISPRWADGKSGKAIAGRVNDLVLNSDRSGLS